MEKDTRSCRVCLCKAKSPIALNATCESNSKYIYVYMFNLCTQLNAALDDQLPQFLCTSCAKNLVASFDFLQIAQCSNWKLKRLGENGKQTFSSEIDLKIDAIRGSFLDQCSDGRSVVECMTCDKDPLEETDEELAMDLNTADKNQQKHDAPQDIWSEKDFLYKISDNEDEDDRPLGQLIKTLQTKQITNDDDTNGDVTNSHANDDKCLSPSNSLADLNASPEEQLFPQGRFKCKICEKAYFTAAGLKVHINIHLPKNTKIKTKSLDSNKRSNKFATTVEEGTITKTEKIVADVVTKNKENLRKQKLPKPKKLFPCNVCGKHMISASKLRYHMVMHTGEKDYLCTICPRAYSTIYALKHHMRTHTGERPYECKFCGDKFTRPTTLKSHMRRHTGERPYGCDICGKRFIQHSSMTTHMKLNHMAKTIPCPHCDKKYARQIDLTTHLLSHTGDKPFSCQLCPSRFIRQANLNKHMNQHHTDKSASSLPTKERKKLQKEGGENVSVDKCLSLPKQTPAVECSISAPATYNQSSDFAPIRERHVASTINQQISDLPSNMCTLIETNNRSSNTLKSQLRTQAQMSNSRQHFFEQAIHQIESEQQDQDIDVTNRWTWPHATS